MGTLYPMVHKIGIEEYHVENYFLISEPPKITIQAT